jgi:predicted heme/steroid binding protein
MARHLVQHSESHLPTIREGLTKKQITDLATQSVENLLEEGNVFQVAEALAAMEEFTKAVRRNDRYVEFLREELIKHNGRLITTSGAKIEVCEAGVSYDYSNNGEWRELEEQIKALQEKKKEVEEKLRKVAPGRMAVDPETGEVIEGAFKTSKSTYRITLAR